MQFSLILCPRAFQDFGMQDFFLCVYPLSITFSHAILPSAACGSLEIWLWLGLVVS